MSTPPSLRRLLGCMVFAAHIAALAQPVATPSNAIVYGSGGVTQQTMMRAGMGLNLLAIVLITIWTEVLG